ncbi:MAG: NUDIX hydrolase [Moraxellaceae bacterium]|nr:NUDIX hydrolase [Moraxellaceae bacterium]
MKHYHPKLNDKGEPVTVIKPSIKSDRAAWTMPNALATATPGSAMPESIGEIDIQSWNDAPTDTAGWESFVNPTKIEEPAFAVNPGKKPASGAVIVEYDGRVWVFSPTNQYMGYVNTFPKGKIDPKQPLSMQANAVKEAFEETGLKIQLIGFLCDSQRDTTTTRYYLAHRVGGNPADMGWESQAVHLVPRDKLQGFVEHSNDAVVLKKLTNMLPPTLKREDVLITPSISSVGRIIFAVNGFRCRHGEWPTRIKMDASMADAIQDHVLTPLGWTMMSAKMDIVRISEGTVIAENRTSFFEYDAKNNVPHDTEPADVWIWGLKLLD